ncbi:mitogen-activated protein kinase maf1 [Colletotrichum tofieldiae]|nr:mitogen-activated protein kinase maf1 [Colletotrichum tofieldiae]
MQMFSHSSAFGPLSELSSRRTFAYLIATLNASHQHYDFSHVLRPGDFKKERNLRRVMGNLDSILQNVRPHVEARPIEQATSSETKPIDKEMRLNECTVFSYNPDVDPFEEDESAIWAAHYFFFNRALKRVAYLYVRVVPVVSSQSPRLQPALPGSVKRTRSTQFDALGANKRAKYWLGNRDAELVAPEEDDEQSDGFLWNRGADGDLVPFSDDDYTEERFFYDEEDDDETDSDPKSPVRRMSEDVVAHMEI